MTPFNNDEIFSMITVFNTTGRPLHSYKSDMIVHNLPFFKEELRTITKDDVKDVFKGTTATVIVVNSKAIAVRAHVDNPNADIYLLVPTKHCLTLEFKGTNGIKETTTEVIEDHVMCSSEMINWK